LTRDYFFAGDVDGAALVDGVEEVAAGAVVAAGAAAMSEAFYAAL